MPQKEWARVALPEARKISVPDGFEELLFEYGDVSSLQAMPAHFDNTDEFTDLAGEHGINLPIFRA